MNIYLAGGYNGNLNKEWKDLLKGIDNGYIYGRNYGRKSKPISIQSSSSDSYKRERER